MSSKIAFAASTAYLRERGQPNTPADLVGHDAIRYRLRSGALLPWILVRGDETVTVDSVSRLVLSVGALDSGLSYARLGMGIIGTFRNWLENDFSDGTLKPVLADWWPVRDGPRLYYPSRFTPAPLRAFIDFCREAGRESSVAQIINLKPRTL